jgi:hypothetical protein
MSSSTTTLETTIVIQPTREQLNRFIIQHVDWFCHGSSTRNEEFARQLIDIEKEYNETGGSITLTNKNYMLEHWNDLVAKNFVLGEEVFI